MRVVDVVREFAPRARPNYLAAFETESLLAEHGIVTPIRLAHFLAQVLHETGGLTVEWENMNYSAPRLVEIFGARHSAKVKQAEARALAHNPALIAERVYGLGNPTKARELGNTEKGDGFRYRGGGLMQTTGRFNYKETGKQCGVKFEEFPELIVSAEHALKPALIEWTKGKLNGFADADDILAISRAINLGNPKSTRTPNGLDDRKAWLKKVRGRCEDVAFAAGRRSTRGSRSAAAAASPASAPAPKSVPVPEVLELQRRLAAMQLYLDTVDGIFGPATSTAIQALFLNQGVKKFELWPSERSIIAARQVFCRIDGIDVGDIDGLVGPMTEQAFLVYAARKASGDAPVPAVETWRDDTMPPPTGSKPPKPASAKVPVWPRQSEVQAFFGAPGSGQTSLELPFRMRLAWDPAKTVTKTSCHTKVRPHLERIWVRTLDHYGLPEIQRLRLDMFGGCLNVRKMRGGTEWSMHSWGIAWDVDPARNALKMKRDEATLDAPEYDAFWGFVYEEGAISLGRERNFDWMHFQFARL